MKRSRLGGAHALIRRQPLDSAEPLGRRSKTRWVRERLAIRNAPAFHDWRGIPCGEASRPVQPFIELPLIQAICPCELRQSGACACRFSAGSQRGNPEASDKRPDSAIVILPVEVLLVPMHVGAP